MAFLSDDALTQLQDKMESITEVAKYRDEVFAKNKDKPMKIVIGAVVGMWFIYHFLIKR